MDTLCKALIIDDEADICYLMSGILKQKNIQTVFAGSLEETDKILQSDDKFGYIFLDDHLPDGFGSTYIRRLKNRFPGTSKADIRKAEKNGVDFFIGKPFSREKIFNAIDSHPIGNE
jgi:CheY-like chemotaxis protein